MAEKRGRKRKNNMYFGPEQEDAVVQFLECDDEVERNKIYNQWLREPLNKMVESIIRKYKLYRKGETFEDLHSDTLSFLILKADKFEQSKGKKAYSYYGTICKNYMLGLLINDKKRLKQIYSYEDYSSSIEEKDDYQYVIDDVEFDFKIFIQKLIDGVEDELVGENSTSKKKLSENERRVGEALIAILSDWEVILDLMNGGTKYNKNTVLESMRNYTNLNTKDIRLGMRRYKELYKLLKIDSVENGLTDDFE
jgi:hypothetical protein